MREQNVDRAGSLLITAAIIIFFASVPFGIFIVSFIHQSFYLGQSHWFFDTPISSYFSMVAVFLFIAVMLISAGIYLSRSFETRKRTVVLVFSSLMTISVMGIGSYLSLDNYYYMDKNGLFYDELWKIEKTVFEWDDITAVKQVNKNDGGTLTPEKIIFTYGDEEIELPLSPKLRNEIDPVIEFIENTKGVGMTMENITGD